jgi:hypothetical protein
MFGAHDQIAVKENVDVDFTRPPAGKLSASHQGFDLLDRAQKRHRRKVGGYLDCQIDEGFLLDRAYRLRFIQR